MNWKHLFDKDRLDRGYNYYIENRVYDVILTENSIVSKVEGSRSNIYEVKITFNDDEIDSLYCTCPYYYSDFNCKHMVATLHKMEEIKNNTQSNILDDNYDEKSLFADLIKEVDEKQLRQFIYEHFNDNTTFMEEFINEFQQEFTPEDFDNYENMLENIFNIDVVELYNENGFYQDTPFQKYLENFINDKINLLYKNEEYNYALQLLYMIYENISKKTNAKQYIEIDTILNSCNYYMEKIIDKQDNAANEEIFTYLINKIRYDFTSDTTKYFINLCLNKFNSVLYLKQLDSTIGEIIQISNNPPEKILLTKYELMNLLDYPLENINSFLEENKEYPKIMEILIDEEIKNKNIDNAIKLLNENKEIHGNTFSFESDLLLLSLYKCKNDNYNAIRELKTIIYDFDVKDMYFIKELKELLSSEEWNEELSNIIIFYEKSYSYDFLNDLYIEEHDVDKLFYNIINNCQLKQIEEYREYFEDKYSSNILSIYQNYILNQAKTAKNISGYTLIIKYLNYMISYNNSTYTVKNVISTLKKKYKYRELLMEKINEFELLNSLI
ncbi:MAG: hypothetical protein BZ135_07955 [Methanosphaera sp. rholeuAM6]|nr:MAG: hypothetical protein BZ135_07955 [Methanosphaera sp. rholeuAM6]